MKRHMVFMLVVLAIGSAAASGQQSGERALSEPTSEMVNLTPRFMIGQTMRYRHILTMTQKQKYSGFAQGVVSLQMISNLKLIPTRLLPGGGAEVELSFDRLSIDAVPSKRPRFQYDTELDRDRPGNEDYVRAIRRVAETVVIFELSAAGQVQSVVGAREIERLIEGQPGFELIASVLSERWLREVMQDVFGPAGAEPKRKIGDTWRTHLAIAIGGFPGAETTVDWTLKTNTDGESLIEGDAHPQAPVQVDPNLAGLEQRVTGTFTKFSIVWDQTLNRSRLVEKSEAMSLDYRANDFLFGTTTLGTHSLLESLDP